MTAFNIIVASINVLVTIWNSYQTFIGSHSHYRINTRRYIDKRKALTHERTVIAINDYLHKIADVNHRINSKQEPLPKIKLRSAIYMNYWAVEYVIDNQVNIHMIQQCIGISLSHVYHILIHDYHKDIVYQKCMKNFQRALIKCDILNFEGGIHNVK